MGKAVRKWIQKKIWKRTRNNMKHRRRRGRGQKKNEKREKKVKILYAVKCERMMVWLVSMGFVKKEEIFLVR